MKLLLVQLHFFNSSAESIIFYQFTAEVSSRSSLILKLSSAVQLNDRQANVSCELLVTLFPDEEQDKNQFKDPKEGPIHVGGFGGEMLVRNLVLTVFFLSMAVYPGCDDNAKFSISKTI